LAVVDDGCTQLSPSEEPSWRDVMDEEDQDEEQGNEHGRIYEAHDQVAAAAALRAHAASTEHKGLALTTHAVYGGDGESTAGLNSPLPSLEMASSPRVAGGCGVLSLQQVLVPLGS
jgi:hypothetical protein